jgi:protein gp37
VHPDGTGVDVGAAVWVDVSGGVREKMNVWLGVRVSPVAVEDGVDEEVNVAAAVSV